jgi:mannose-6-phosphate isomerase-like protein (cupin superfamily)
MAYIFHEDKLPRLISAVPGRERTFFVNKELTKIDDMLAGIMHYKQGASSPYHLHENCEHFYFIMEGNGTVETPDGTRKVGPGAPRNRPCSTSNSRRPTGS